MPGMPMQLLPLAAQMQQTVVWQGQFPPPEAMGNYEKILPGSFDRIISMAERLQAAQIEETRRAQEFMRDDTRRGHWLGFSAIVLAFIGAGFSMELQYPWVAGTFLSVSVMGVAKALIDSARPFTASKKTPASSETPAPSGNTKGI
jgi:uncharacterized membrane protein